MRGGAVTKATSRQKKEPGALCGKREREELDFSRLSLRISYKRLLKIATEVCGIKVRVDMANVEKRFVRRILARLGKEENVKRTNKSH